MPIVTPNCDDSVVLLLDPSIDPATPISALFAQGPVHANILGGFGSHVVVAIAAPNAIAYRMNLDGIAKLPQSMSIQEKEQQPVLRSCIQEDLLRAAHLRRSGPPTQHSARGW